MQCKLARAFYASLSRVHYPFHPLSLPLSILLSWLHKSTYSSTSPPSPPRTARPHLENCNFHAKLVHAAQLASTPTSLEISSTGSTGDPLAHFSTRDSRQKTPPAHAPSTRRDETRRGRGSQNSQWQFFICELRSTAKCEKINIDPDTHSIYTIEERQAKRERERDANNNNKNKHCKIICTLNNIQKWQKYRKLKKIKKLFLEFLHSANGIKMCKLLNKTFNITKLISEYL